MRFSMIAILVACSFSVAHADDAADVKQAYVTYLQARMDRDIDAAKKASVGDEQAQRFLELDIERQVIQKKFEAAAMKFDAESGATSRPTSQPAVRSAAETFKFMLDNASVNVEGDQAKIVPKGAPAERAYGFRKIDGVWKADLNKWEQPIRAERLKLLEANLPLGREVLAKIERGEITTKQQLSEAMNAAERTGRKAVSTQATTQPAR